jgi:hypothetical protein
MQQEVKDRESIHQRLAATFVASDQPQLHARCYSGAAGRTSTWRAPLEEQTGRRRSGLCVCNFFPVLLTGQWRRGRRVLVWRIDHLYNKNKSKIVGRGSVRAPSQVSETRTRTGWRRVMRMRKRNDEPRSMPSVSKPRSRLKASCQRYWPLQRAAAEEQSLISGRLRSP